MTANQIRAKHCFKYGHSTRSHTCIRMIESMNELCLRCRQSVIKGERNDDMQK